MGGRYRLGDLQLAIMRVLWEHREATVAEVHAALHPERGLALTTIATMLRKLEAKRLLNHRVRGRRFVFRPRVSQRAVRRSMVADLLDRLFEGDAAALVSHLLTERLIGQEEVARLKAMIESPQRGEGLRRDR